MSDVIIAVLALVFIVVVDTIAVYIAASSGMKYPFMAAAIVNLLLVIATHIVGIAWIISNPASHLKVK